MVGGWAGRGWGVGGQGVTWPRLEALQTRRTAQFITHWTLFTSFWGIPANRELRPSKRESARDTARVFVASVVRNWQIDPTVLISKPTVWQILSTYRFVVSTLLKLTLRLRAELQKVCRFGQFLEQQEGQRIWMGRGSVWSSFTWSLLWIVHFVTSLTHPVIRKKRKKKKKKESKK